MAFERFRFGAGFEALNVHTKGPGEALTEVISGRADCYFALGFQAQKMRDAGKLDALVVSALQRTHNERNERSEENTSELQSPHHIVCRILLVNKITPL